MYKIGVQKTPTGQFRVVLFSADNGKLVLSGEPLKNRNDAEEVITGISQQWNRTGGTILFSVVKLIPASKKWPKNSGPKRKPKTFIALAGKYKGQKVTERATPVELRARKDSQWITNPDGTTGTYLKIHLKPVKSTTKSGKR